MFASDNAGVFGKCFDIVDILGMAGAGWGGLLSGLRPMEGGGNRRERFAMTALNEGTHSEPAGLIGGSWRQLSDQLGRAACALRAITDFPHQGRIIFPGHLSQGTGRAAVGLGEAEEMVRLPVSDQAKSLKKEGATPAQQAAVWVGLGCDGDEGPLEDYHSQPTVLLCYGAESHLAAVLPWARVLRRRGVNVAVAEYLGFGLSSGEPSERGCVATVEAALAYLLNRPDIEPTRIVLMGAGLGAAVATDVAGRCEAAGLVCLSAFTSMTDLLRWRLPQRTVDALVRQRFDTAEKMKAVRCPVLIAHGGDDQIVPAEMSRRLQISTRSICRRIEVADSNLHGLEMLGEEQAVLEPLMTFIKEARPRLATTEKGLAPMVSPGSMAMRLGDGLETPVVSSSSRMRIVPVRYATPTAKAG